MIKVPLTIRSSFLIISVLFVCTSISFASDFALNPLLKSDTVKFESTAKLEFIEGITTDVAGYFSFDKQSPTTPVSGLIRVDLRTMHTGIETRDEDMRSDYLETDEYPYAYFELVSISNMPESVEDGKTYETNGFGYFYIHGVKRKLYPIVTFNISSNETAEVINVSAKFTIKLDEYKIKRPKLILYKLAETMNLTVTFTGYSDALKPVINLPDYKELE